MSTKLVDVGAERAVLAGLFTYGIEAYVDISDLIDYKTFGHQNNQILYKCIEKILQSEASVDIPSILSRFSSRDHIGCLQYTCPNRWLTP